MLGWAVNQQPYGKSYGSRLLCGKLPITPRVERAARILLSGMEATDERCMGGSTPIFESEPIEKLEGARAGTLGWQELYASNAKVREFVDTLIDIIIKG